MIESEFCLKDRWWEWWKKNTLKESWSVVRKRGGIKQHETRENIWCYGENLMKLFPIKESMGMMVNAKICCLIKIFFQRIIGFLKIFFCNQIMKRIKLMSGKDNFFSAWEFIPIQMCKSSILISFPVQN